MTPHDRLLTVNDLAAYLGVPATTLYQWRYRREEPRGFRVGRHIRYRWSDVENWIAERLEQTGVVGTHATAGRPNSATDHRPIRSD